jgi:hypothetical protein
MRFSSVILSLLVAAALAPRGLAADDAEGKLARRFAEEVQPLVKSHCLGCHGEAKQEGKLSLSRFTSAEAVAKDHRVWELARQRLAAGEMPPEEAPRKLAEADRKLLLTWIDAFRDFQAERHAGDPGEVLARRLNSAEFDYTIRDLTGVDIRPTKEFPVDPANEAGFDNSAESLAMSPALLQKYLAAARHVAEHAVLLPDGFRFAPHPAVTETDRDKYCVHRIIEFYQRHEVDLADYFLAAWRFRHRAALGQPGQTLAEIASGHKLSGRYLERLWRLLTDAEIPAAGPVAAIRTQWQELPPPASSDSAAPQDECESLRVEALWLRKELATEPPRLKVKGISDGTQPFVLWRNRQGAEAHTKYLGNAAADAERLRQKYVGTGHKLAAAFTVDPSDAAAVKKMAAACEQFCRDIPAAFVISDRGPYFDPKQAGKGRFLTAGFHLMQGYFRDDQPLYELILTEAERRELDGLWQELNFITQVPLRQYQDFIFFERAEPPRFMFGAEFDFARSEDKDAAAPDKMRRLKELHLALAQKKGAGPDALGAIETYYANIEADIRWVERTRLAAEPSHLAALAEFAQRAYRRPLAAAEGEELQAFYRRLRERDRLPHDEAFRDTLASVLLSPHFCYRFDLAPNADGLQPLSDYALASRLSYFLWSSMPDAELLGHAAAGDLRQPEILLAQARRMLRDPKVRGLAVEFGGNWLDFRRFEEHNAVDRERFPSFDSNLRQAMFEEPVRLLTDALQHNRSVLALLDGPRTFVNAALAKHYGISFPADAVSEWIAIDDARAFGRGGLLPMAVFLTKNSPGLRTSPVKRGYWVVRRLLGEHIPAPPPTVPELPKDEAQLGELTLPQLLARHRADKSCSACHERFDSLGLAYEGFGPIGERRTLDLGGRPVQAHAVFPGGSEGDGLEGLRRYFREHRQQDYVDNLCRNLLSYALSRSLLPSDQQLLDQMQTKLAADGYAIGSLIESIVTSPQFTNRRGEK